MGAIIGVVLGVVGCVILYVISELFFHHFFSRMFEPLRWWLTRVASREPRNPEQVSCSIRSVEAPVYGFRRSWTSGTAAVEPGTIQFVSGGTHTTIAVISIGPLAADDSRGLIRSARVLLHTPEGILEISMLRAVVDRVRQAVRTTPPSRPR